MSETVTLICDYCDEEWSARGTFYVDEGDDSEADIQPLFGAATNQYCPECGSSDWCYLPETVREEALP